MKVGISSLGSRAISRQPNRTDQSIDRSAGTRVHRAGVNRLQMCVCVCVLPIATFARPRHRFSSIRETPLVKVVTHKSHTNHMHKPNHSTAKCPPLGRRRLRRRRQSRTHKWSGSPSSSSRNRASTHAHTHMLAHSAITASF